MRLAVIFVTKHRTTQPFLIDTFFDEVATNTWSIGLKCLSPAYRITMPFLFAMISLLYDVIST